MPQGEYQSMPMRESIMTSPQGYTQNIPQNITPPQILAQPPQPVPILQHMPQKEFYAELPATYPAPEAIIAELPAEDGNLTPTASRRTSNTYRVHELAAASVGKYSPIQEGPFADEFSPPNFQGLAHRESNPSLARAAESLPGSLLPPAAIADLKAPAESLPSMGSSAMGKQKEEQPAGLPSYANKPYLAMLSENQGREGPLPSPPRARGSAGRPGTAQSGSGPPGTQPAGKGGIGNRDSTFLGSDEEEWPAEALMHMGIGVSGGGPAVRRKEVGNGRGNGERN
jgi:hypothetical protein